MSLSVSLAPLSSSPALDVPIPDATVPDAQVAVRARGLTRRYGAHTAVDGIDFDIRTGEAFGFLGPNGAGKSTTMKMIHRGADVGAGTLEVLGLDAASGAWDREIKARIGVVQQEDNLDRELTVRQTLEVFARFHRLRGDAARKRVDELLVMADLVSRADAQVEALSGGMKRRLAIARGLIPQPALVLLDEPTTGLDPRARQRLWEQIRQLRQLGTTVLLTTHYMDEAEQLCDRIVILDAGRIRACGAPADLIQMYAADQVVEVWPASQADIETASGWQDLCRRVELQGTRLLLFCETAAPVLSRVAGVLAGREVRVRRGSLDDVYLRLTGRGLED